MCSCNPKTFKIRPNRLLSHVFYGSKSSAFLRKYRTRDLFVLGIIIFLKKGVDFCLQALYTIQRCTASKTGNGLLTKDEEQIRKKRNLKKLLTNRKSYDKI
ncbi:MAG: hypothetical protein PWP24_1124 [Clostridiales bacterium]|nr:hypothetical protein [Clostridiales bacterium]